MAPKIVRRSAMKTFTLLVLLQFIRLFLLAPLLRFVMKSRVNFERQNRPSPENFQAVALFEISSQGEWEQVAPLVRELLNEGGAVDILYASPSVEAEMQGLEKRSQGYIRTKRLELLTDGKSESILKWSSAPVVFLCRYDFYPELLLLARERKLVLLNATLKNKAYLLARFIYRPVLELFDLIVWSSELELERARSIGLCRDVEQMIGDLRPLTIIDRQKCAPTQFDNLGLGQLRKLFERLDREHNVLLGSGWPSDFEYLAKSEMFTQLVRTKALRLWIAPHKIGRAAELLWRELITDLMGADLKVVAIGPHLGEVSESLINDAHLVVNLYPRILCESYVYFSKVIVGGGFERSAHSISEPFYSGAFIGVGPKTHRSTEFDEVQVSAPGRIVRFENIADLQHFLAHNLPNSYAPCQDRESNLVKLRKDLCSLAMSTPQ